MSDPSRLVDDGVTFESSLLRAWSERQPSEAARMKTLAAVGLAGGVLAASGTAAAGASSSIAPKALVASSLLKWFGIGAGLVAAAGAIGYASHRTKLDVALDEVDESPAPVASAVLIPSPETSSTKASTSPPLPTPPTPPASPARTVAATAAQVMAPKAASVPPVSSSLDEEVLAIDHARRTLAAGDGVAALQLVDAYEAKYPNGVLTQESTEIRIEALYRTGNRALADKLAASFLAAHPATPYARVIRALQAGVPAP